MNAIVEAGPPGGRAAGLMLVGMAIVTGGLLINHPSGSGHTFAEVLRSEAADQVVDAIVHGGFIVVLSLELVGMAIVSARIGLRRPAVIAALVFALFGAGFLALSMCLDGLVLPAIAVRYAEVPEKVDQARSLFVLLGTLVRFLMPVGLLFQAASVAAWSAALWPCSGIVRTAAIVGIVVAVLAAAGIAATAAMSPHMLIGALVGMALWYALVGVGLARGQL
jgi:hypothetical protein